MNNLPQHGVESIFGPSLLAMSGIKKLRRLSCKIALRLERGPLYSMTTRKILRERYGVSVGLYSYGPCMAPGAFPAGVIVGRYVSVASGVRVLLRNHPLDRLSTHPFFYNASLGWVPEDNIDRSSLLIDHDAWIGERAIITASCRRIGVGAAVGAGAVVTHDVPDFAVVGGVPARLIRYRFEPLVRKLILSSQWWDLPISESARYLKDMTSVLPADPSNHPLLRTDDRPPVPAAQ